MTSGTAPDATPDVPTVPPRRTCGQMQVYQRLLEENPGYRTALGTLEASTRSRLRSPMDVSNVDITTIPVVVHILYSNDVQNIPDDQVQSQIEALNRDYGAANADKSSTPAVWSGLVTDTRIRFALATKDPSGQKTTGITRTRTAKAGFSTNDGCKSSVTGGVDPWPTEFYLNIWVCNLRGGILGYAQFPEGPSATDGVVILYTAFGTTGVAMAPFNLGRTAVHEVGHWLNLRHIWGDTEDCSGTDYVDDTPKAEHPNYGRPVFPHISCANGPHGDMFMNYMDYVDDGAMVMFTAGQVARMQATLAGPRSALADQGASLVA